MKELLENQLRLPRRIKIKYPHFTKWVTFACRADYKLYFPSSFQLEEYCKRKEHKKCPLCVTVYQEQYVKNIYT
jgi:hypothetical protein